MNYIPKFKEGDSVIVYRNGELISRTVVKIRILIGNGHSIGYQFKEESPLIRGDYFDNEKEVFASKEDFLNSFL